MDLKARCPDCGRAVSLPMFFEATTVVRRTCKKCRQRWSIKIVPQKIKVGLASICTYTRLG